MDTIEELLELRDAEKFEGLVDEKALRRVNKTAFRRMTVKVNARQRPLAFDDASQVLAYRCVDQ